MTVRAHRSLLAALILVGVVAIAFALTWMHSIGYAHADGTNGLTVIEPAPTVQAEQLADGGWRLVEKYGPIWGAMLLLIGVATVALRRNRDEQWLAQGRTLAIITAVVGVLGAIAQAKLGGESWAGVLVTLVAAVKLVLSPTVAPTGTAEPPKP